MSCSQCADRDELPARPQSTMHNVYAKKWHGETESLSRSIRGLFPPMSATQRGNVGLTVANYCIHHEQGTWLIAALFESGLPTHIQTLNLDRGVKNGHANAIGQPGVACKVPRGGNTRGDKAYLTCMQRPRAAGGSNNSHKYSK